VGTGKGWMDGVDWGTDAVLSLFNGPSFCPRGQEEGKGRKKKSGLLSPLLFFNPIDFLYFYDILKTATR